jgi:hypothetical protein
MAFPPHKKDLEGVLVDIRERLDLLERRGSVQRLGARGLQVADWNDAQASGFYWSENALNQGTGTGLFAGVVSVHGKTGNVRQLGWRIYADASVPDLRVWERNLVSGVWHPWTMTSNGKDQSDSGWVTPTFVNGFTSGSNAAYRRIGNVTYLRGELLNSAAPTTSTQAFVLPVGYRPTTRHRVLNWASSGDPTQAVFLTAQNNGSVDVLCTLARTATPGYSIAASFLNS